LAEVPQLLHLGSPKPHHPILYAVKPHSPSPYGMRLSLFNNILIFPSKIVRLRYTSLLK
jgi:hypothetical protein